MGRRRRVNADSLAAFASPRESDPRPRSPLHAAQARSGRACAGRAGSDHQVVILVDHDTEGFLVRAQGVGTRGVVSELARIEKGGG